MPRIVRITRDMRPWSAGQDAVLPDDLAAKLIKSGEAENSRPYPPPDVAPTVPVGSAEVVGPTKRFQTRKRV
jgi:hypothetical protein